MSSAVLPNRHETHWANSSFSPNINIYNPRSNNRFSNQASNFNSPNPNPNPSRYINVSSRGPYVYHCAPPVAPSSRTVDIKAESSQGGRLTINVGSYSRNELIELKNRFILELEQVQIFRHRLETRELELRPNNVAVPAAPPKAKNKKNAATPAGRREKKFSGKKRRIPVVSSGREIKRTAKAAVLNSRATQKVVEAMMRRCGQILAKLMSHKHGWVFNKPVDAVALGLHNYHQVIKHPMDLGTVKSKLGKDMYGWPLDFASDVRLTFENALTYNTKGDDAHSMATVLLSMFEEMFNPAFQKFEAEHRRIIAAQQNLMKPLPKLVQPQGALPQQNVGEEPLPDLVLSQLALPKQQEAIQAPAFTAPAPVVVHLGKLSKTKAEEKRNKREMSREEREKLSLSLQNLPDESMDEILQIVTKRNSELGVPDGNAEIVLDIHALDNETLWELERYVGLCILKAAANKMRKEDLIRRNSTPALQINKSPVLEKVEDDDVDIGDEMPMNHYPPLEIEKDAASSGRSSSSSSSSSGSDSASSSDSDNSSRSGSDADSVQSPGVSGNP